ncbi:MAG: putative S-layer protein [archaeon]
MEMDKVKLCSALVFSVFALLVLCMSAVAVPLTIDKVKLDGDEIYETSANFVRDLERGEEFQVKVEVTADSPVQDAQIEVALTGIHNQDVEDTTDTFDMIENVTYLKTLTLVLPDKMDREQYKLRVRVEDRDGDTSQKTFELLVSTAKNNVIIKDVTFSPAGYVKAGRALLANVVVKNMGLENEDMIKVTVSIPELGITASDYISELDNEKSTTSEELYLRIPACAEQREYSIRTSVVFDDGDDTNTRTDSITVTEGDICQVSQVDGDTAPSTVITVGTSRQDVRIGQGSIYPITVRNAGTSARTYTVTADATGTWATLQVTPTNILLLQAGEVTTVYVYLTPTQTAAAGESMFSVTVSSGDEILKQIPLKANVVSSGATPAGNSSVVSWSGLRRLLEIGVVAFVILIVIIGLIIGFNKLKGNEDDEEPGEESSSKTYY